LVSPEYGRHDSVRAPVEKLIVVVCDTVRERDRTSGGSVNSKRGPFPVGAVVPEPGVTVAVSVTVVPTDGLAGETATVVVVPPSRQTEVNAVARLEASTEPSPVA